MTDIHYHGPVVAFDLDDTLFSEYDWAVGGYRAAAARLHAAVMPQLDEEEAAAVMERALRAGENPFDALGFYCAAAGLAPESFETALPELLEAYRFHKPDIDLFDDAVRLLAALSEKGVRTAIVTDGRSRTQRAKIEALGIRDHFHPDDIFISEETGVSKPSVKAFASLVRHYPEASGFCYVGDNPAKDFIGPNMLGWTSILAPERARAIHPREMTENPLSHPHYVAETLCDVLGIMKI